MIGQIGVGGLAHAGLEGLSGGELLFELDGAGLVDGGCGHVELGLGCDAGAVGGVPLAHPLRLGGLALAVLLAGQTGLSGQLGL